MPSKKSATATLFCKVCHRPIEKNSIFNAVFAAKSICLRCFLALKPTYVHWKENGIPFTSVYRYEEAYQSLIYLYKGCGDYELRQAFLERLFPFLKIRYRHYVVVPAPSSSSKIDARGFDHLPAMFEGLGKEVRCLLQKTSDFKQSDQNKFGRKKVGNYISLLPGAKIRGEKVLLVDDVFTTGATVRACLKLLQRLHPAKIEVLVLARVAKDRKHRRRPSFL